ncbi:MAG: hypothetical protein ACE37K_06130 [Planctomycetota bacterium]
MIPADATQYTIRSRVNSFALQFSDRVLLYSGYQRKWVVLPVSAAAVVTPQNDHALIVDGTTLHGWSPRYGTIDTITVSNNAVFLPNPPSATYVVTVQDGNDFHAYGSYAARWSTLSLPTPAVAAEQHRRCAIVHDGTMAYGYSSYSGDWVATPAPEPGIALFASGDVCFANSQQIVRGFSAPTSSWSSTVVADSSNLSLEASLGYIEDQGEVLVFSGNRGAFSSYTPNGSYVLDTGSETLAIEDQNGVTCYSSIRNSWATLPISGATSLELGDDVCVVTTTNQCAAYSGVTGQWSPVLTGAFTASVGTCMAFVDDGIAQRYAYTALGNRWLPVPTVLPFVAAEVLGHSVLVTHTQGFSGIGARFDQWQTLVTQPGATVSVPNNRGRTAMVTDTNRISAWNGRLNRWASVQVDPNTLTTASVRFSSSLLEDGDRAFAFGVPGKAYDGVTLSGDTVLAATAGSGISYVQTDDHMHAYSPLATLTPTTSFPETDGFAHIGRSTEVQQVALPGSLVTLLVGFAPTSTVTPFGELLVDTPLFLPAPLIPTAGNLLLEIPVPNEPGLIGYPVHLQSAITPPAGLPYLTGSTSMVLL